MSDDDALFVARYTIEDNSEDKIIFDEYRSNDISVIKTVFRNLIGKFEILSPKDEIKIHEDVADVNNLLFIYYLYLLYLFIY